VDAGLDGVTPFSFLAEDSTPAQQLSCARRFARRFASEPRSSSAPIANSGVPRVGFVSSGFNQHATGLLVVELIERLRGLPLQTFAFSTTPSDGTPLRRRLEAAFGEFHDVAGQPVADIAARIRAGNLDVLIDIDGYCMGSLPVLFAQRLAPVQVNWLAYPGSLGAPWYDYLIADHFLIPTAQRVHYDEKIAWLPRCYQPTDTTRAVPEPARREDCGLPPDRFVFCCFNNNWKYTPRRFALWMRLLAEVPDSVLWLLDGPPRANIAERLRAAARRAGIDPQRLVFSPKVTHAEYLARLRCADLFLDTAPYGAHTTASDAIFAGCPVLTAPGDTFASRVAGSLNRQLGLDELNARDEDDYLRIARELARSPERIAALRAQLADPAVRARLFDIGAYARDFAALLTRMTERARRGEAPVDLSLT
ncbi:MAG TPA: UDP-N-acetylglucosamine-peptide N-acetylglucosaminyltransferase, partial [Rudaea sp.]